MIGTEQIRLEALKLALVHVYPAPTSEILRTADAYANFIIKGLEPNLIENPAQALIEV